MPSGKKKANKYSYLLQYTASIRVKSAKINVTSNFPEKVDALFYYLYQVESHPDKEIKNLQILLGCNFLNQVYSAYILFESGLYAEGLVHFRIAIEIIAYKKCYDLGLITKSYFDTRTHSFKEIHPILKAHNGPLAQELSRYHFKWSEFCHLHSQNEKNDKLFRIRDDKALVNGDPSYTVLHGGEFRPNDLKSFLETGETLIDLYLKDFEGD